MAPLPFYELKVLHSLQISTPPLPPPPPPLPPPPPTFLSVVEGTKRGGVGVGGGVLPFKGHCLPLCPPPSSLPLPSSEVGVEVASETWIVCLDDFLAPPPPPPPTSGAAVTDLLPSRVRLQNIPCFCIKKKSNKNGAKLDMGKMI